MNRKGLGEEGGALALPRAVKLADRNGLFFFLLLALPPVSRGLASIYIFRFPLPRPGFGKRLNAAGRPAAALTPRRDRRCLQLPFFYPPRSVTPIIPSRGWRPEASRQEIFLPPRQRLHAPQWRRSVEEVFLTASLPFHLI